MGQAGCDDACQNSRFGRCEYERTKPISLASMRVIGRKQTGAAVGLKKICGTKPIGYRSIGVGFRSHCSAEGLDLDTKWLIGMEESLVNVVYGEGGATAEGVVRVRWPRARAVWSLRKRAQVSGRVAWGAEKAPRFRARRPCKKPSQPEGKGEQECLFAGDCQ